MSQLKFGCEIKLSQIINLKTFLNSRPKYWIYKQDPTLRYDFGRIQQSNFALATLKYDNYFTINYSNTLNSQQQPLY